MMKSNLYKVFTCIAALFFSHCGKDTVIENMDPLKIEFKVFYTINGDTLLDVGSKVFAYYTINQSNILDYFIQPDGKLIDSKDSSTIIYPNLEHSVEGTGKYTLIPPKGTESLLVIIWSNFYKERKLKSLFTEYDFYYHGENQTVKLYFTENNQGVE